MMEFHCTVYGRPHYFTADSGWHLENESRCCSFALVVKTSVTENSLSWSFTHSDDSIKASPYKWHAQGMLYIVWWQIPFHLLLSKLTQCFKYHSTWFLSYETVVTSQWRSQQVDKSQFTTLEKIKLMLIPFALCWIQIFMALRQSQHLTSILIVILLEKLIQNEPIGWNLGVDRDLNGGLCTCNQLYAPN